MQMLKAIYNCNSAVGCAGISPEELEYEGTMMFASVREDIFADDRKHFNCLVLYTPLFNIAELHDCATKVTAFKTLGGSDIDRGFAAAGGIAQTVLLRLARGRSLDIWINEMKFMLWEEDQLEVRCSWCTLQWNVVDSESLHGKGQAIHMFLMMPAGHSAADCTASFALL